MTLHQYRLCQHEEHPITFGRWCCCGKPETAMVHDYTPTSVEEVPA